MEDQQVHSSLVFHWMSLPNSSFPSFTFWDYFCLSFLYQMVMGSGWNKRINLLYLLRVSNHQSNNVLSLTTWTSLPFILPSLPSLEILFLLVTHQGMGKEERIKVTRKQRSFGHNLHLLLSSFYSSVALFFLSVHHFLFPRGLPLCLPLALAWER